MAFKLVLLGLMALGATARPQFENDPDYIRAQQNGEMFDTHPVYAYSYQVADDDQQTYVAQQESRDGSDVTGEYSYVDANGSLVTVTYSAGINGYTEERDVQANFVTIRARPASRRTQTTTTSSNSGASTVNLGGSRRTQQTTTTTNSGLVNNVVSQVAPAVRRIVSTETTSSSSSDDSDLVARILSQLTPLIRQTVSNSLSSNQQQTVTTRRVQQQAQPIVTRRIVTQSAPITTQQSTTSSIFGTGGANNIRFENPDINYSFDLQ